MSSSLTTVRCSWAPPDVACSLVTWVSRLFSFLGTTVIVFALTLPPGPGSTASMPTLPVPGRIV
jgi:hypothetical protein